MRDLLGKSRVVAMLSSIMVCVSLLLPAPGTADEPDAGPARVSDVDGNGVLGAMSTSSALAAAASGGQAG